MGHTGSTSLRAPCVDATFSPAGFWDFVASRHRIWVKRQEGQPPPWTDDPIFQEFHFCNVYRELDRGTQWYLEHVVPKPDASFDFVDALWRTITYRLVNNVAIFERVGGVAGYGSWLSMIMEIKRQGIKLNSKAYLTLSNPVSSSRVERLVDILFRLEGRIYKLAEDIYQAETLQEVCGHLQAIYGIGPFVALQVARDLILAGVLFLSEDEWTSIGPGAEPALRALTGGGDRKHWLYKLKLLREIEVNQLEFRGFSFLNGKPLSLCDLQQAMCEYRKYVHHCQGIGNKRRYRASVQG